MSISTIWDQVLSRIEDQVGKHSFSTWFKPTTLLADGGQSLSISVPNPLFVEWLPKHYSVVLAEALRDVGRPDVKLVFVPDGGAQADAVEAEDVPAADFGARRGVSSSCRPRLKPVKTTRRAPAA